MSEVGKSMTYPKIGILGCCSNASNNGTLVSKVVLDIVKDFNDVGVLSLPALATKVPRQVAQAKKIKYIVVIDGCHQACASNIAKSLGIKIDSYINLELDLGIKKKGPFTTFEYDENTYNKVKEAVVKIIRDLSSSPP